MTNIKITNRILNGFLLKKGIKSKYIANMIKAELSFSRTRSETMTTIKKEWASDIFDRSFHWNDTSEGWFFWEKISRQYKEYHSIYYKP